MRRLISSLLLVFTSALAACGDNQDPAGADAFWKAIHDQDYTSWARAPGFEDKAPSNAVHAANVTIYLNDTIAAALEGGAIDKWPEGSIIVKEGYDGDELFIVAAMEKRADGWYWGEWSADGATKYSGKPEVCTSCHESGADYVRAFGFPQ